ncbi:ComEC/Rec2 family competence protein [Brevibacillus sp. SAFN-007a]|uniref:ComEC/Rec2 family competence protein n=1 Tax=Brevibacillus sp. SAFN-007a TaxID=3436862 RepID=UPI003F80F35C
MSNKAKEILIPNEQGVFRVCFLYVGQGDATLLSIPTDSGYQFMLIDANKDKSAGGIDLSALLQDLTDGTLHYFVNTHPHKDHLDGLKEIVEKINIEEVWHSGHIPAGDHCEYYEHFKEIIDGLEADKVKELQGTREEQTVGKVRYNVLSPAEYVKEEISGEDADTRNRRIHEHCAVIRFLYGEEEKQILITGDADLVAWRDHITNYHKDRLQSTVLSAVHHGSRTFFKNDKDDEPYLDHIKAINASYLVVSAPKQEESKHDHPHDDAMELYREYFDEEAIFHLGENRECVIVDIYENGDILVRTDQELVETYGYKDNEDDGEKKSESSLFGGVYVHTKLDTKPMGGC